MASWEQGQLQAVVPSAPEELSTAPASTNLWDAVDQLVDRAPRASDLVFHRLQLLAARRYRSTDRLVSRELREEEQTASVLTLLAPLVLDRARAAYDDTILLMKGPEIAARYPDPVLRPFRDLDLLVPDAAGAQRALLAAGFVAFGPPEPYVDIHHLQPLQWPGSPLLVEIHQRPKWVAGLALPSREAFFASAVPGSTGIAGILAPSPELHAMVVAAHSWGHAPLTRLGHLVDLLAVTAGLDRSALDRVAAELGIRRVWRATIAAADALLDDGRRPWSLRLWARNLDAVREPTVLESHLGRWLPPWWGLSPRAAFRANAFTISRELGPLGDETWQKKLRRTIRALRGPTRRLSDHQRNLGEER